MNSEIVLFEIRRICRIKGIYLSPKKEILVKYLITESDFFYAEDLYFKIRERYAKYSMSTVYHTLTWLFKHGIAEKVVTNGEKNRYKLTLLRQ